MPLRDRLDRFEQFAIDVILERRYGKRALVLRWVLKGLSWLFLAMVNLRLLLFRARLKRPTIVGVPVIAVGNLTVGGTGKTPVVERLARELQEAGRNVCILSRGYKSEKLPSLQSFRRRWLKKYKPRVVSDGKRLLLQSRWAGDEPYMLARALGNVVVLVDRNRCASARHAVNRFGCDLIILDDGMQYLNLKHRLDICLIDRNAPFGNEHLLPRGTLREPPSHLARAGLILITKTAKGQNAELIARIRQHNRTADIVECAHRPVYLENVYDADDRKPLSFLKGKYVGAISAIAEPESFETGLRKLGGLVEVHARFADHHRYAVDEVARFLERCQRRDLDLVVTTEKDAVRFPPRPAHLPVPVYFLRIDIEILEGRAAWEKMIARFVIRRDALEPLIVG